jgi:hypothetical protein
MKMKAIRHAPRAGHGKGFAWAQVPPENVRDGVRSKAGTLNWLPQSFLEFPNRVHQNVIRMGSRIIRVGIVD